MIQDANMLILFGEEAPEDLSEYCFKIDNKNLLGSILEGGKLVVDNQNIRLVPWKCSKKKFNWTGTYHDFF